MAESDYIGLIGDIFEKNRQDINQEAESLSGISQEEFKRQSDIFGRGIREGLVRYEPDTSSPGILGRLHVTEEKGGKKVDIIFPIRESSQAALLLGLQDGLNKGH